MWSGTAASWMSLHPAGTFGSVIRAMNESHQVGEVNVGVDWHASVWSGTSASWTDLHAFLPAGFTSSRATGVSSDSFYTYVSGYGYNDLTQREEALVWMSPVPEPASIAVLGLGAIAVIRRRHRR